MAEILKVKQVIVVRTDLGMSIGKVAAQVAHASLGAIKRMMEKTEIQIYKDNTLDLFKPANDYTLRVFHDSPLYYWWDEQYSFTKVVLGCDSEKALLDLEKHARDLKLPNCLIIDMARTELKEKAPTCVAIGPDLSERINEVTGHLKLF